ncbi:metal-dependent hydrolase family protein [Longimycelium tulufanense]|nr:amidohydrolase family protein [Longimycelium tulufanense]
MHEGAPLVLIQDCHIVDVDLSGSRPAVDLPVTDLGDVTLLPGLVDAHSHLAFDPTGNVVEQMRGEDDATLLNRMREHARQALSAGITTIRDLGDRNYLSLVLRDEFASDGSPGPKLLVSGPPITSPGGHCWFLGGEAAGVDALRAAVAERITRGVDVIKVMATGGGITPGSAADESQFDADELRAVVEAAHGAGKPVTAHAHGVQGIADAVRAGVDGIEHCTFLTADGAAPDWDTVRILAKTGIYVGVTAGRVPRGPLPAHVALARRCLPRMQREGVRLVCSSDAGVTAEKPHDCLPHGLPEFAGFVELPTTQALAAVTSLAAESCDLGGRKGRIASGYDADILAVTGNPVRQLEDLCNVAAVFCEGQRVML